MSVLALQTALLAAYSEGVDFTWLTALVGTAICISSAFTGVYMLVNGFNKNTSAIISEKLTDTAIAAKLLKNAISTEFIKSDS